MSSKPAEKWWERLGRMVFGWGFAFFALWIFSPRVVDNKMSMPLVILLIVIVWSCMSMAHSTVFAITMQTAKGVVPWLRGLLWKVANGGGEGTRRASGAAQAPKDDGNEHT